MALLVGQFLRLALGYFSCVKQVDCCRTSFGLLRLSTSENAQFTFSYPSWLLLLPFGALGQRSLRASLVVESCAPSHLQLPRDLQRLIVPIYFSFMNAVGGLGYI
jgi:hypothetical protein